MDDMIKIEKDMTPKLIGETYMKYPTETSRCRESHGIYECQYCGKEFEAITAHIKSGNTRSCGCQNGGRVHGLANSQFYNTWKNMDKRCNNPKNKDYKNYGARGISIEFIDYKDFIDWALQNGYDEGLEIDRKNNDGNYSKDNCRFVSRSINNMNRRCTSNSGFKGVSLESRSGKYKARIKNKFIGYYMTAIDAAKAYNQYIIDNGLPNQLNENIQ